MAIRLQFLREWAKAEFTSDVETLVEHGRRAPWPLDPGPERSRVVLDAGLLCAEPRRQRRIRRDSRVFALGLVLARGAQLRQVARREKNRLARTALLRHRACGRSLDLRLG